MNICPICRQYTEEIVELEDTILSVAQLYETRQDDFPVTKLTLEQCPACNYMFNRSFDPSEMEKIYKSKAYKSRIVPPQKELSDLIRTLNSLERRYSIIEVGSGNSNICYQLNGIEYKTIDPSIKDGPISHISKFLTTDLARELSKTSDLTIARHVLEHVVHPSEFVANLSIITKNDGYIYIEVPNFKEINAHGRSIDLFNDHYSYFDIDNLCLLGINNGLTPIKRFTFYREQHIGILFKNCETENRISPIRSPMNQTGFSDYQTNLNFLLEKYNNIALWGAGAHGNAVLDIVEDPSNILVCFDIDKQKEHLYMLHNIEILYPSEDILKEFDTILIASALHEEEIAARLPGKNIIYTSKGIYEERNPNIIGHYNP